MSNGSGPGTTIRNTIHGPSVVPRGGQAKPTSNGSESEFDRIVYMKIPHSCAGAVIGHEGIYVKKIIQDSGAHVYVAKAEGDKKDDSEELNRMVTIQGTPDCIAKVLLLLIQL